jgi:uncharacterized protein
MPQHIRLKNGTHMKETINKRLIQITKNQNFTILYACETGSRGWGFASPDSDFDVRFIFVWPQSHYLRLDAPKADFGLMETIEGECLDFNGWELSKVLRQIRRSNATPFEWLQSPILYQEKNGFRDALWALAPPYFDPRAAVHHYLGICHNSLKSGVIGNRINIKKYFYVLRPLLAAMWAVDQKTVPPMSFAPLLVQLQDNTSLLNIIHQLWAEKEQAPEGHMVYLIPEIQTFIEREMERCRATSDTFSAHKLTDEPLNAFFSKTISS